MHVQAQHEGCGKKAGGLYLLFKRLTLSFSAERQCQTGLTCTNGGCVRIPSNGSEVCECNSGYELSGSDSTLCIGKCRIYMKHF